MSLLHAGVDRIRIALDGWIVYEEDARLARNIDWRLDLLLAIGVLRRLRRHGALVERGGTHIAVDVHALSSGREAGELLLKLLLTLSKVETLHLHLLKDDWVHLIKLIKGSWGCQHLLRERIDLLSSALGVLTMHIKARARSCLRHTLIVAAVVLLVRPS